MISEIIEKWIKGILIDGITGNLSGLFDNVNAKVGEIASDVGSTPQASETCSMSGMPATSARNAVSVIKSKATPANRWDFLPMGISRTRTIPSIGSLMKKLHKLSGAFLI